MAQQFNHSIQEFMNSSYFVIYDKERTENLVVNAQIATSIEYLKEKKLMKILFVDRVRGKKDSVVTFLLPIDRLSNAQISMLLSYKKKQNERKKR